MQTRCVEGPEIVGCVTTFTDGRTVRTEHRMCRWGNQGLVCRQWRPPYRCVLGEDRERLGGLLEVWGRLNGGAAWVS